LNAPLAKSSATSVAPQMPLNVRVDQQLPGPHGASCSGAASGSHAAAPVVPSLSLSLVAPAVVAVVAVSELSEVLAELLAELLASGSAAVVGCAVGLALASLSSAVSVAPAVVLAALLVPVAPSLQANSSVVAATSRRRGSGRVSAWRCGISRVARVSFPCQTPQLRRQRSARGHRGRVGEVEVKGRRGRVVIDTVTGRAGEATNVAPGVAPVSRE